VTRRARVVARVAVFRDKDKAATTVIAAVTAASVTFVLVSSSLVLLGAKQIQRMFKGKSPTPNWRSHTKR